MRDVYADGAAGRERILKAATDDYIGALARAVTGRLGGKVGTAGGKTEAAFLPLLSRMLADDWRGLSLLYVCPIRALLAGISFPCSPGSSGSRAASSSGSVSRRRSATRRSCAALVRRHSGLPETAW